VAAGKAISQSDLLGRTLALMEEDTQITRKAGKDFIESLRAAVEEALGNGEAVTIAGLVKLTPAFKLGGKREVFKEFGNPSAGKEMKNFPDKIRLGANALKPAKDAVPSVGSKAGKELKEQAKAKREAAEARKAKAEKEAKKAAKADNGSSKKGSTKKKGKKK
jgi:hypothetical protein